MHRNTNQERPHYQIGKSTDRNNALGSRWCNVMCADHTKPAICRTSFHFLVYFFSKLFEALHFVFLQLLSPSYFCFKKEQKRQNIKKNRKGMFFLNMMAQVSCVELFNVMEPAAETQSDSCSLLKICTRELFLGGSVCVCTTRHDD